MPQYNALDADAGHHQDPVSQPPSLCVSCHCPVYWLQINLLLKSTDWIEAVIQLSLDSWGPWCWYCLEISFQRAIPGPRQVVTTTCLLPLDWLSPLYYHKEHTFLTSQGRPWAMPANQEAVNQEPNTSWTQPSSSAVNYTINSPPWLLEGAWKSVMAAPFLALHMAVDAPFFPTAPMSVTDFLWLGRWTQFGKLQSNSFNQFWGLFCIGVSDLVIT